MKNVCLDFSQVLDRVLFREGGYVNDPLDRGGETRFGISKRAYPGLDIANLGLEQARAIYKRDYWDRLRLGEVENAAVAEKIFDVAVNMGRTAAVVILQRALNLLGGPGCPLRVDGVIGPRTLGAVNYWCRKDQGVLLKSVRGFQFMRYVGIVKDRPEQVRFVRGWLGRL